MKALWEYAQVRIRPEWLTATVTCLAEAVWDGGFDGVPILADALDDAGCDMLEHCRRAGRHGGNRWVFDPLLGVEELDRGSEDAGRADSH